MANFYLSPIGNATQFFTSGGLPLNGGFLSTYAAGTSTPLATYTTPAGTVANPLAIQLNVDGRLPQEVWLAQGSSYKFVLTDSLNNLIATYDNISGIVDINTLSGPNAIGLISGFIASSVTLNVPAQYATIQSAFTYLATQRIVNGATVTIKVADGTYNLASSINLNHPDGEYIQLIGNTTTPTNCIILGSNPPTFDAITCTNGYTFGLLNGFYINLTAKATLANNFTGVLADEGSTIICGTKISVSNWYYGIAARNGSFIYAQSAIVNNAGDVGFWAYAGSAIDARFATSNTTSDVANGFGFGFQAEYGSEMDCSNASATGCNIAGIAALTNSNVRALTATSSGNVGSGFLARDDGNIENHNATANNNTRYGEEYIANGTIRGNGKTLTGNTLGVTNGYAYFDNSSALGARIASNGDLRIDNNGTGSTFFNTAGGVQNEIRHIASTSSHFYQQGGAPSNNDQPSYGTDGTAIDISGRFQMKGAGLLFFNNANGTQAAIGNTLAAVNHLELRGGSTGNPAAAFSVGTDAVIDLALFPKGAGSYVQLGAGFVAGAPAATGYISFKDSSGVIRKLLVG